MSLWKPQGCPIVESQAHGYQHVHTEECGGSPEQLEARGSDCATGPGGPPVSKRDFRLLGLTIHVSHRQDATAQHNPFPPRMSRMAASSLKLTGARREQARDTLKRAAAAGDFPGAASLLAELEAGWAWKDKNNGGYVRILRAALKRDPEDIDQLAGTNRRRSLQAAEATAVQVRQALDTLGDRVPPQLAETGLLRIEHQQASLDELGRLSTPRLTKDQVAGRLRRLLDMTGR